MREEISKLRKPISDPKAIACLQEMLLWVKEMGYTLNFLYVKHELCRRSVKSWLGGSLPTGWNFKKFYRVCHKLKCPHCENPKAFDYLEDGV